MLMNCSGPLYFAKAVPALPEGDLARTIQLFPPGVHETVVATKDGTKVAMRMIIDAAGAEAIEADRAAYQAEADAGAGDAPFLDFNHEDREASAWPKRVFWAGDDPIDGGIRAEVEWSAAGEAAVVGKTFRRFSPAFFADKASGRLTGAPVNMGGLVNRAAFRRIAPLFAKESEITNEPSIMNESDIAALQSELASLKEENDKLKAELEGLARKDAENVVAAAAKDGRIPAAPEFQAKWVDRIVADKSAVELLLGLPVKVPTQTEFVAKAVETPEAEKPEALLAKFNALPRDEKPAFFAKHSEAIVAAREAHLGR